LDGGPVITDGGLETWLIFQRGVDLPHFASCVLLDDEDGVETLRSYFEPYLGLARKHGTGFLLDTTTWRASGEWGARLGYSAAGLDSLNRRAVELARDIGGGAENVMVVGIVGPRGDGYSPAFLMDEAEAERYHTRQVETLADAEVDVVKGVTLTYPAEAIGIVRAASAAGAPAAVSFTVETDGRLPDGTTLREAVECVDDATDGAAAYFMVNCAHPTHIAPAVEAGGAWLERIRGIRANASRRSHAELDESGELDPGDPAELAASLARLRRQLPAVTILGGCCGTDERHIAAICETCLG
jgi:homocysteine S-methyltransferase